MPIVCIFLFILISPTLSAQENISSLPDIHEFIYVDHQPRPLNMYQVRQAIGYPPKAYKAGIEGYVHCRILVDIQGKYVAHKITKTSHPLFSEAVEHRLTQLQFTPASRDDIPISYWVNIPFLFEKQLYHTSEFKKANKDQHISRPIFSQHKKARNFLYQAREFLANNELFQAKRAVRSCIFVMPKGRNISDEQKIFLSEAWQLLGSIEMQDEEWSYATHAFSEAIALQMEKIYQNDSTLTYLFLKRGQALLNSQQHIRALEDVNWVLQRKSHNQLSTWAHRTRAMIYMAMKDYESALGDAQTVLDAAPNREHYFCKAVILYKMQAYTHALSTLEHAESTGITPDKEWSSLAELLKNPVAAN